MHSLPSLAEKLALAPLRASLSSRGLRTWRCLGYAICGAQAVCLRTEGLLQTVIWVGLEEKPDVLGSVRTH